MAGAYALATLVLTWPFALSALAASGGEALALRGDYQLGIWNLWWFDRAVFELGVAPGWTDLIFHPIGVSLARHVLNPVSALPGALASRALGLDAAFALLVVAHFWAAALCAYLLARELTGSRSGAFLAGLVYSFSPFHLYYVAQLNAVSTAFLPLAGYFLVRAWRGPGAAPLIGSALAAALLARSSAYYVVYAALLGVALLAGGRFWDTAGAQPGARRRLLFAGAAAGVAVALVAWPLLSEAWTEQPLDPTRLLEHQLHRSNDLLGFAWIGPPERVVVAWPAMIGYSTLALLVAGLARARASERRAAAFWIGVALLAAGASLGPQLFVGGRDTGIPLPYRALLEVPVLSMLRKPDRAFALTSLCLVPLIAISWRALAARLPSSRARFAALAGAGCALAVELSAAPLHTFPLERSAALARLSADAGVDAIAELPRLGIGPQQARANRDQTVHGKRVPQAYVVDLALTRWHERTSARWDAAQRALIAGDPVPLVELAHRNGVDRIVLHRTTPKERAPLWSGGAVSWLPFRVRGTQLVELRQRGSLEEAPLAPPLHAALASALGRALGSPVDADEHVTIYAVGVRASSDR